MTAADLAATTDLLAAVFPGSRLSEPEYLQWLYENSPFGHVIEANLDDGEGRAAHYAVVPVTLAADGNQRAAALSLNTAVHERARGGGVFVRLAEQTYEAARARGVKTIVGVANANSTPGFVRRLGFELIGPLPATVLVPVPALRGRRWNGTWASSLDPDALLDTAPLLHPASNGLARLWTPETLAWRLRSPGSRYAVHRSSSGLAVSTRAVRGGVPVAIILKVFAPTPLSGAETRALVFSVAAWHRAPAALHVGLNEAFRPRGIPLPDRLRDSPLNLIRRDLVVSQPMPFTQFEFLDFDAY